MATMYYEQDAPLDGLKGKKVCVIGCGSQGHAHSQNLRYSGIEVSVRGKRRHPQLRAGPRAGVLIY